MWIFDISTQITNFGSKFRSGIPVLNPDHEFWFSILCKTAISTLRAIQIKLQIQIKNSGSRFDEGIEVRIFGSHFLRKIHIRGVLTFWPWCYFLTLVSRLPAFSWPVLPLGVHRTPAAGELSPAELWWPMHAKSTFQSCSLLSTLHFSFAT